MVELWKAQSSDAETESAELGRSLAQRELARYDKLEFFPPTGEVMVSAYIRKVELELVSNKLLLRYAISGFRDRFWLGYGC